MSDYSKKIILASVLKKKVEQVLAVQIEDLNMIQKNEYESKLEQLTQGIPIDYILGKVTIGELELQLNSKTLIPRPETEIWINQIKNNFAENQKKQSIVDLGCGCGLIGLSLAAIFKKVILIDIEPDCLVITEQNAIKNTIKNYQILLSDGLLDLDKKIKNWVLISNPPYLPIIDQKMKKQNKVEFEPSLALYSGEDGLDMFRRTLDQLEEFQELPVQIYFELDPRNIQVAKKLFQQKLPNYKIKITKDFDDRERFMECYNAF
jgi:release factor glutamine methyltransferase